MDRKIDFLFLGSIVNDKKLKEYIELYSMEIQPAGVSFVVEVTQLNKSIRYVSACRSR
ncbi:hypothetical protein RO3G_03137 [Rhizopus delemar RA 99-880]|uniref:Uncharacterized protein n=1 Tax=Rhizopus delemar (strain RA 99-880 / ATCC MYA-4621 / FGSC 9543 / NRRL 43880) TaxID=246409 RepID=I1BQF3_RHIO9|nr:hypothetical protein RO3G_03137 [Rhizopus delemar RA 99-880]|eukprot:EIE78433.1 hypothetical protein RO3G_03137 [Rhizopus delemar RA 99-880]